MDLIDLKNLRLVSHQSNEIVNLTFTRTSWFVITSNKVLEDKSFNFIAHSQKNVQFKNVKFEEVNFTKLNNQIESNFWQLFGDSLEYLSIDGGKIDELPLLAALDYLSNLKNLHIKIESDYSLCNVISCVMDRVREIKIEKCPNQNESTEQRYLNNLEHSDSVVRKLTINFKSNTTLLFELPSMQRLFVKLSKSLKELYLNSYLTLSPSKKIQEEELNIFDKMKFKLDSLKIRIWGGMDCDLLQEFSTKLVNLRHLDVTWHGDLTEKHKIILHDNLRNLERFVFKLEDSMKPNYSKMNLSTLDKIQVSFDDNLIIDMCFHYFFTSKYSFSSFLRHSK